MSNDGSLVYMLMRGFCPLDFFFLSVGVFVWNRLGLVHRPRWPQRSGEINVAQGKNFPWGAKMSNDGSW